MISVYPLFELATPNPLFKMCDAVVFSKKQDHKFIFLKENKPKKITRGIIDGAHRILLAIHNKQRTINAIMVDLDQIPEKR